jgi:gliding motility-associated-like protein
VNVNSQLIVTASADVTVCNGDSTQLNVTNTGTYNWSPPTGLSSTTAQNPQAGPATTTTYTVQVTDSFGCQGTDSVTVSVNPIVTVAAGTATTICIGQQATLTATGSGGNNGPYTYSWNAGTYTGSPVSVSPTTTTTYSVVASDGLNCPSAMQTVVITVNPPIAATVAASTGGVCVGGTSTLTATGAGGDGTFTYNWMPGSLTGASVTVTPSATTTYTVTVSDGCGSPVDTAQVTVTVNQPPVVSVSASSNGGCAPFCITITGTSTSSSCVSSSVTFGDGNSDTTAVSNHCYTQAGSYDVTFTCTDGNGCTGTTTQVGLVNVSVRPSAGFTTNVSGGVLLLSGTSAQICATDASAGGTSWAYLFNNSQLSTQQSPCFTVNDTGTYCIYQVVADAFGCADSTEQCVSVVGEATYSIPNVFTPNADGTNDVFTITNSGLKALTVDIFDRWGVKVYEWSGASGGWDGRTTSGQMAVDGVYYYIAKLTDYGDKVTAEKGFVQLLSGK